MLSTMMNAAKQSCDTQRLRFTNVRWAGKGIAFDLDGVPHTGHLNGRNADLVLGFGDQEDASIAMRVWLDGDAMPNVKLT